MVKRKKESTLIIQERNKIATKHERLLSRPNNRYCFSTCVKMLCIQDFKPFITNRKFQQAFINAHPERFIGYSKRQSYHSIKFEKRDRYINFLKKECNLIKNTLWDLGQAKLDKRCNDEKIMIKIISFFQLHNICPPKKCHVPQLISKTKYVTITISTNLLNLTLKEMWCL